MVSVVDPTAVKNNIQRELTDALYQNNAISLLLSLLIASTLFWELTGYIEKKYLVGWYFSLCTITGLRGLLLIWYRHTKKKPNLARSHFVSFFVGSSLAALLWGILGSLLMPNDVLHQIFILIILSGVLAGAAPGLHASYITSIAYLLLILLPLLSWEAIQIIQGHTIYVGLFLLMAAYCIYSIIVTYRAHLTLVTNIELKLENIQLLEDLKKYTAQIELLSQLGRLLAWCSSEEEICMISAKMIPQIIPELSGGVFLLSETKDRLKAVRVWGDVVIEQLDFPKNACYAIQESYVPLNKGSKNCIHCNNKAGFHTCIPLTNQNETLGILHLGKDATKSLTSLEQTFIERIASDINLAIVKLKLKKVLEAKATHDLLTGLFNRRYLEEYLNLELKRANRKNSHLSIIMLDIDSFKHFNDNFGHEMGDIILREIGRFLTKNVRGNDVVCRYGGEEFIISMPETGLDTAYQRAESIRTKFQALSTPIPGKLVTGITLSLGVAVFPDHGSTPETLIDMADQALYKAKQAGKNQTFVATRKQ